MLLNLIGHVSVDSVLAFLHWNFIPVVREVFEFPRPVVEGEVLWGWAVTLGHPWGRPFGLLASIILHVSTWEVFGNGFGQLVLDQFLQFHDIDFFDFEVFKVVTDAVDSFNAIDAFPVQILKIFLVDAFVNVLKFGLKVCWKLLKLLDDSFSLENVVGFDVLQKSLKETLSRIDVLDDFWLSHELWLSLLFDQGVFRFVFLKLIYRFDWSPRQRHRILSILLKLTQNQTVPFLVYHEVLLQLFLMLLEERVLRKFKLLLVL